MGLKRYFLVITDVGMPGLNGIELLSEVRSLARDDDPAPPDVIIVTGKSAEAVAIEALRRGAYDYFRKPFSFDAMKFTIHRLLERRRFRRQAHQCQVLTVRLEAEKEHAQQAVAALVEAVYAKDRYTRGHMERVGRVAAVLGRAMGKPGEEIEILYRAGTLHDIGKIGTPDLILNKPGSLSPEEWETIRLHPVVGANILTPIAALESACRPVRCHHERWDGSGYPDGIAGEQIPLAARIVAIADVYDALSVRRVYKAPFPHETCVDRIRQDAGRHFDPNLVEVFLSIQSQFREIAERFSAIDSALAAGKSGPDPRARDHAELCMSEADERLLQATMGDILEPAASSRTAGAPVSLASPDLIRIAAPSRIS
jgi:putative two-component system response regulator